MSDNFNIQAFVQKTRKEFFDNMYKKTPINEELDPETADRIDGLTNLQALNTLLDAAETNLQALNTLLDAAEMIYKDQIESGDEFDASDVAEYLHSEISKRLTSPDAAEYLHSEISKRLMSLDPNNEMDLREADEEDVTIDAEEETVEAPEEDIMDEPTTEPDMGLEAPVDLATGGDSKEIFGKLVDAYEAAKGLGDEKLTRQLANTITYFNKAVIFGEPKQ